MSVCKALTQLFDDKQSTINNHLHIDVELKSNTDEKEDRTHRLSVSSSITFDKVE